MIDPKAVQDMADWREISREQAGFLKHPERIKLEDRTPLAFQEERQLERSIWVAVPGRSGNRGHDQHVNLVASTAKTAGHVAERSLICQV